ncbi:CHAT domain-containing protein [Kitasatospora sp. NPDC048365]|uniref:CHAT domain-containing protein n=1 Tax=Kitasatospora sp. NPDC048365 TaxID=3364050 RepID=UPI00371FBA5A
MIPTASNEYEAALHEFVRGIYEAPSWVETRQLILDHPQLVTTEAIELIALYEGVAAARGDEDSRARFVNHRRLLQGTIDADVDIALGDATPLKDEAGFDADTAWYCDLLNDMLNLPRWIDRRWMMEARPYLMHGVVAGLAEILVEDESDPVTVHRLRTVTQLLRRAAETTPARAVLEQVARSLISQDSAHDDLAVVSAVSGYVPLVEESADAVLAELVDEIADPDERRRAEGWLLALRRFRTEGNSVLGRDRVLVLRAVDLLDELHTMPGVDDIAAHLTEHPVLLEDAVRAYVHTSLRGDTPHERLRWQFVARLLDRASEISPVRAVQEMALRDRYEAMLALDAFVHARTQAEEEVLFVGFPGLGSDEVRAALAQQVADHPQPQKQWRADRLDAFRAGRRMAYYQMWEGGSLSDRAFQHLARHLQIEAQQWSPDDGMRLVGLLEVVLRLAPADAPPGTLDEMRALLITGYMDAFDSPYEEFALDRAVELHRALVESGPEVDLGMLHRSLATVLDQRAEHREGDGSDREEAVAAMRRALELTLDPDVRIPWLIDLVDIATSGQAAGYRPAAMREAEAALDEISAVDPEAAATLRWRVLICSVEFGDPARVADAVARAEATPGQHGQWLSMFHAVIDAYLRHPTEDIWFLVQRVSAASEAAAEQGDAQDERHLRSARVRMLLSRADKASDAAALDQALALTAHTGADAETELLVNRAHALMLHVSISDGTSADLDEAVRLLRTAHQAEPGFGSVLAEALVIQHERTGEPELLDEAIRITDESSTRAGQPPLVGRNTLAVLYRRRFQHNGQLADLETAIALLEEVIDTDEGSYSHTQALGTLGSARLNRFEVSGDPADLDTAIRLFRTARQQALPQASTLPSLLTNLSTALATRANELGRGDEDLPEALEAAELAVALTPAGSSRLARRLVNLANAEQSVAAHRREAAPAESAGTHIRRALDLIGPDSPFRPLYQAGLAQSLLLVSDLACDEAAAEEAFTQAREALTYRPGWSPQVAVHLAGQIGRQLAARSRWAETAEVFAVGATARRILVQSQPLGRQRQTWLRRDRDLPMLAAYATARAGDLAGAVELVETARATELTRVLDLRPRQLELAESSGHDELVRRWNRLTLRLNRLGAEQSGTPGALLSSDGWQVPALVRELEEVGDQLERAGTARSVGAGSAGDVIQVHLIATEWSGLALIVRGTDDGPRLDPVPLPDLTQAWAAGAATTLSRAPATTVRALLPSLLADLGRRVMGPVTDAVAGDGRPVVFLAGGHLGLLPLHAAGLPGRPGVTALDVVDIRHAPNARVLAAATAKAHGQTAQEGLAIGGQGGAPQLRHAAVEARLASTALDSGRVLDGAEARTGGAREALLAALGRTAVVHFAGHARSVPEDPLASALILTDGDALTMAELLGRRLRARLVVMSACRSGVVGKDMPDEVIGFPTALLQAGVAGVIATLWPVPDDACLILMLGFYEGIRSDLAPPEALRRAQQWLRDATTAQIRTHLTELRRTGAAWPPADVLDGCFEVIAFHEPDEHPFAGPEHWAGFIYIGA